MRADLALIHRARGQAAALQSPKLILYELQLLGLYGRRFSIEEDMVDRLSRRLGIEIVIAEVSDEPTLRELAAERVTARVERDPERRWATRIIIPATLSDLYRQYCIAHELSHVICGDPLTTPDGAIKEVPADLRLTPFEPAPTPEAAEETAEHRARLLLTAATYGDLVLSSEAIWLFDNPEAVWPAHRDGRRR